MTDLNERLAAFAMKTGRTCTEWLEAWRDGHVDKTLVELHGEATNLAIALSSKENDDAR